MNTVLCILSSSLHVLFCVILFSITGHVMIRKISVKSKNWCYDMAISLFVGVALFLIIVRTVSWVMPSYRIACWIALVIFLFVSVSEIWRKHITFEKISLKWLLITLVLWGVNAFYQLIIWYVELDETILTPSTSVGSQHSIRYVNIAQWFIDNNCIPVLNQSYGQSILGSLSILFGMDNTNFHMSLWLAISKTFMLLFLFGFLRECCGQKLSILLVIVVFCGSVSLSAYPIKLLDTGSPFYYSGYTDSIMGVCTFAIFLAFLIQILTEKSRITLWHCLFTISMMMYWCMSAPQNIIITGAVGLFLIIYLNVKKENELLVYALYIAGAVLVGVGIGIIQGGMLTPAFLVDEVDISGVMTVIRKENTAVSIALVPSMPYFIDGPILSSWSYEISYMQDILQYALEGLHQGDIGICIYHLSILWWDSIRIIFWPLVGILGISLIAYRTRENKSVYWSFSGMVTLVVGYVIAFSFSYCEYKRELTRFMMPCYFLGMIFVALLIGKMYKKGKLYRYISVLSIIIILCGQIPYRLVENIQILQDDNVLEAMADMIMYSNQYIIR